MKADISNWVLLRRVAIGFMLAVIPLASAVYLLGLYSWDLTIPLVYDKLDDIWQLTLTKALVDNGWVLTNSYLGAPDFAYWHYHAAAQTSAIHSVLMLAIAAFVDNAVKVQQIYYLLNFPLITASTYLVARAIGITRVLSFCIGMLFAFTTYRINNVYLAFLANYFAIPLSILPILWILCGDFETQPSKRSLARGFLHIIASRRFVAGLFLMALVAPSDGYYAFFTLLLLGYAGVAVLASCRLKSARGAVVAALYCVSIITVQLGLMYPLAKYKSSNLQEFLVNGNPDPALIKQPFEAEVYVSSLKLLIAPINNHRLDLWADLGKNIVATSDATRLYKIVQPMVSLGTLGTILLIWVILTALTPRRPFAPTGSVLLDAGGVRQRTLLSAIMCAALFVFLSSISGGIGTLVALVYPTIRAYDRFPLYLVILLLLFAGVFMSAKLRVAKPHYRVFGNLAICLLTVLAILDQVPRDAVKGAHTRDRFLAERHLVQNIEASLPEASMIYQYPYSQYLTNNKYYGWGAFGHLRLYLHSRTLRWSNGASKNSAVDNWHMRLAELPLQDLVHEIQIAGFSGIVVDRTVVPRDEYAAIRAVLTEKLKSEPIENDVAELAFWKIPDPGVRVAYDKNFRKVEKIVISDAEKIGNQSLPTWLNAASLQGNVPRRGASSPVALTSADRPELLHRINSSLLVREQIVDAADLKGGVTCLDSASRMPRSNGSVDILVENRSTLDWGGNRGAVPIAIGAHVRSRDGKMLRWDNGFRIAKNIKVAKGEKTAIEFKIADLALDQLLATQEGVEVEIELVQDGAYWFNVNVGNDTCKFSVGR
jgi:hypothetical protein